MASRRRTRTRAEPARSLESPAVVRSTEVQERPAAAAPPERWWRRPGPRGLLAALIPLIVIAPAWMLRDDLRTFWLFGDDFIYIAESRDGATTVRHLLEPHNAHIVPLFRIWTYVLVAVSGRLVNLPVVFGAASYLGLVVAMLAVGHFVARESARPALGLSAMAMLGISTVTHPAVTWFSAGQALWAGTAIVAALILAQEWCARGAAWRLALVALAIALAPAVWSGGLIAGPAVIVYILIRKEGRQARGPAVFLGGLTIALAALVLVLSRRNIQHSDVVWETHRGTWPRPVQALLSTAQALVESCAFGNLGVSASIAPAQAVALLICLACFWVWSKGRVRRVSALELTGATIAVGGCLMVYTFRGNWAYSELRTLGWYHAIPQVGTIVFAAGWWSALSPPRIRTIELGEVIAVLGLVVLFCLIQGPRSEQMLIDAAPAFSAGEALSFPSTELRRERALYFKAEQRDRQRRALARLDRVDDILARANVNPDALRARFGRVLVPGIPEQQLGCDAIDLLTRRSGAGDPAQALARSRAELVELLTPEVPPTPFWLKPDDSLSRSVREVQKAPAPRARPQ